MQTVNSYQDFLRAPTSENGQRSLTMDEHLFAYLGDWVSRTWLDDVPTVAQSVARRAILDCVGVTLAGRDTDVGEVLSRYIESSGTTGKATLIGRPGTTSTEHAAFVNAAQGHALDFDDCNSSLGGHPSVVVLPPALAVAEEVGATGSALLEAYALGFEVATKMARCVNFTHYERGWHPTATLGVFGATAAAAKLMGLDAQTTTTALAIAASTAAGIKANFGTATKPLQVGRAAQNGVLAARLAAVGADANPGAFEHGQGFGAVFNGADAFDPSAARQSLADPWDLVDPGLTVKRYPCCASTHGAIDAALVLREGLDEVDSIEQVRIWTHPRRLRHTNRPEPSAGLEAKFSVQYVVSRALWSGGVGLLDFTPDAITERPVRELMGRVVAEPMPQERWGADHFPAEVELSVGGLTHRHRVERPKGNGPAAALTDEELTAKFMDCCRAAGVADEDGKRLQTEILMLEAVDDLATITEPLADGSSDRW
ncbi:MAG: MmgE/PrpD family protein [Propionibacteriales bacterium]|nr:MmgE/PrpD family protein [Propionibacteriales bacterium]